MKWVKLGQIFRPSDYITAFGHTEFAQSPQTLILDDRIRIYFSTRTKEPNGKFLSHIAFVDFDRSMRNILQVSKKPVIRLGELGCFDEHGIFPINVVRNAGKIYAYTCGWSRRVSVSVETSIGFAVSHDDGLTFERVGNGPVLTSSLHEPFLVGDGFVAVFEGKWHMWYIYGTKWMAATAAEPPARVYKIGYATSDDGEAWTRQKGSLIADKLNPDECQALPSVLQIGNEFHMYFCFREATDFRKNTARGYRLGYAYSTDLKHWTRNDELGGIDVSPDGWDSEMQCYPHIFRCDNSVYLLYNGNEFGRDGFGLARLESNG